MLLLSLHWPFSPLSFMLHVTKKYALTLLKLPCHFVKLENETVGLLALREQKDGLFVAIIAVARKHGRLEIGTCMLKCVEEIARRTEKRWLEVGVWKKNVQAQRFYSSYGFSVVQNRR